MKRAILYQLCNLFAASLLVTVCFYVKFYHKNNLFKTAATRVSVKSDKFKGTKCILYFTPMWNDATFSFGSDGYGPFRHCEYKNCFATTDRNMLPAEKFSAIVFHAPQYQTNYFAPKRSPDQRYIFASMESPVSMSPIRLEWFQSFYNWTMTYRLDSDIVMSYGQVIKTSTNTSMPDLKLIENKTGLVAWLVSHCTTDNGRERVYQHLSRFIKIDVYGDCSRIKCPTDREDFRSSSKCYDYFAANYKFYLSFENTHCKDYVTEKLYMVLTRNIIPIVYGFADYEHLAPPNSVIHVDKFKSIKELADYINFLDQNPKEYSKYFEWKKYYHISTDSSSTACTLCKMLNDPTQPTKIYENINQWWWGKNNQYCNNEPRISIDSGFNTTIEKDNRTATNFSTMAPTKKWPFETSFLT